MNTEENNYNEFGKILSGEASADTSVPKEVQALWEQAGSFKYSEEENTDAAWMDMKSRLQQPAPQLKVSWVKKYAYAMAAAFGLFLISGTLVWVVSQNNNTPATVAKAATYKTGNREIKTVTLPDGSVIEMNSNSELTVAADFNTGSRQIQLKGQASFEIARNENLPFTVKAGNSLTTVLGTGFDISAYANENVQIVVKHGKVAFAAAQNKLELTKGMAATLNHANGTLTKIDADTNAFSWQKGSLVFKSAKLSEVATAVQHRYGKRLIFSENYSERMYTGKFDENASLESIAKILSETMQIDVTVE